MLIEIFSLIKINANKVVRRGIRLIVNKVLATVVLVIAIIYVIFVNPKIIPTRIPAIPTSLNFLIKFDLFLNKIKQNMASVKAKAL